MKKSMRSVVTVFSVVIVILCASILFVPAHADEEKKDPAVLRTRKTVRMLDDIYKTAVVLLTAHYVNDQDDLPAGTYQVRAFYPGLDLATVELEFEPGEAKTWHFRLSR